MSLYELALEGDVVTTVERRVLAFLAFAPEMLALPEIQEFTGYSEETVRVVLRKLLRLKVIDKYGEGYFCTHKELARIWLRRTAPHLLPERNAFAR